MKITSSAFAEGQQIPADYTCDGRNVNPALLISEIPEKTESLVLVVDDIDAPGGIFTHWVVFDISKKITKIDEDSQPGVAGKNNFGRVEYGGPCPPSGIHRYYFRVFALNKAVGLAPGVSRREVEDVMRDHIIGSAELMGTYGR
ncbi:YbhB/YbcL family Raf kinase inhibitor-like protein [Candidatus Curtissbacteria bacterium]|nr:YbhB/YbcL family Raf kinase inhibitor-like protein [Candidatus Curtissbacteria bacterium]